jgi:hypothetical protein
MDLGLDLSTRGSPLCPLCPGDVMLYGTMGLDLGLDLSIRGPPLCPLGPWFQVLLALFQLGSSPFETEAHRLREAPRFSAPGGGTLPCIYLSLLTSDAAILVALTLCCAIWVRTPTGPTRLAAEKRCCTCPVARHMRASSG